MLPTEIPLTSSCSISTPGGIFSILDSYDCFLISFPISCFAIFLLINFPCSIYNDLAKVQNLLFQPPITPKENLDSLILLQGQLLDRTFSIYHLKKAVTLYLNNCFWSWIRQFVPALRCIWQSGICCCLLDLVLPFIYAN